MPITPYATLLVSVAGSAPTSGGQTASAGDALTFSYQSTVGWGNPPSRVQIYSYPPGFSCPAGWSTVVTTIAGEPATVYEHTGNTPPPGFTLPSSPTFGKWLFRLVVLGGTRPELVDEASGVSVASAHGLEDVAYLESAQFSAARPGGVRALQSAIREVETLAANSGGGGSDLTLTDVKTAYYDAQIGELVQVDATASDITIGAPPGAGANKDERWGVLRVEPSLPVSHVVTLAADDGVNDEGTYTMPIARSCVIMRSDGFTWRVETPSFPYALPSDATPQGIGTAGSAGTSQALSRDDHMHALGFATVQAAISVASSPLGVNSQRITGLSDPSDDQDAATKAYVDAHAGGGPVEPDLHTTIRWRLDGSPYVNSGHGGAVSLTEIGGTVRAWPCRSGDGALLDSGYLATPATAIGCSQDLTVHLRCILHDIHDSGIFLMRFGGGAGASVQLSVNNASDRSWRLYVWSGGTYHYYLVSSTYPLPPRGEEFTIGFTVEQSTHTLKIYLNGGIVPTQIDGGGVGALSQTLPGDIDYDLTHVWCAGYTTSTNMVLRDVRIESVVRSPAEMAELWRRG